MVDATEALESKYLTAEFVKKSNKVLVVIGEGNYEEVTYENETTRRLTIPVEVDQKQKIWRPNRDSVSNLTMSYGKETKGWIGQKAKLQVMRIQGKDSIIAQPI